MKTESTPIIWKLALTLPILIASISLIGLFAFINHSDNQQAIGLAKLFTAEFVILITAACLLIFIFRKKDRSRLKHLALIDLIILISAAFFGVSHFF